MSSEQEQPTTSQHIADRITALSGTMTFLLLNAGVFLAWIVVNTLFPTALHFDPFPFPFLTMAVSLEAIFLSIFVLVSQNRQAAFDRQTMEHDAAVNRRTEQKIEDIMRDMQI